MGESTLCCGVFSLLVGVELICLGHLIACITAIASASSIEPMMISGVVISPFAQIVNAAWSLLGIPIIIGAGVGIFYRMPSQLKTYFYYMVLTFIGVFFWWMSFLFSGSICGTIVNRDVQRMGSAFVCGFTDTFVFFWMLLVLVILMYLIYIVYAAAQDVKESSYPNLMRYSEALQHEKMPLPVQSLGAPKQERPSMNWPPMPQSAPPMMGPPPSMGMPMHEPMRMPMSAPGMMMAPGQYGSMGGPPPMMGAPQSFVPAPGGHY